jgi:hypothetical protein
VLDSECTNHMTEEKEICTSFKENDCPSDTIMFGDSRKEMYLGMVKLLSLPPIILFIRFFLLIL